MAKIALDSNFCQLSIAEKTRKNKNRGKCIKNKGRTLFEEKIIQNIKDKSRI